jgi:AcrR family transcriptional regulator
MILAAARELLDRLPPAEISLRELSRQVGLSKSNVVRYFPTREAVFLAVLVEDWDGWLDALAAALPAADEHREARASQELVAAAIAQTLSAHRRYCDLLASCQSILEHNIPLPTAREFKAAALARLTRLAALVRTRIPALDEARSFEFAGIVWAFVAGAWPMANPAPVVAAALADPQLTAMCVEFTGAVTRALAVVLAGLTSLP